MNSHRSILPCLVALTLLASPSAGRAGSFELEKKYNLREKPLTPQELKALRESRRVRRPKRNQRLRYPYRAKLRVGAALRTAPDHKAKALRTYRRERRVTVRAAAGSWLFVRRLLRRGWVQSKDITPLRRKRAGWRTWLARRRYLRFPQPLPGTLRKRAALRRRPRRAGRRNHLAMLARGDKVTILGAVRRYVKVKTATGKTGYVLRSSVRTSKAVPKRSAFSRLLRSWRKKLGKSGRRVKSRRRGVGNPVRRRLGQAKKRAQSAWSRAKRFGRRRSRSLKRRPKRK